MTQDFFAYLLEKNWLCSVQRRETRFSTLLLTILGNFLVDHLRHESRAKRGGGQRLLSLDMASAEPCY
ncbi:ECF-type sigma factor, partial [Streptococcus pseudopneumoniae]|uniref:ECF-type sigma factor n=1 Tax=Streptococcus pseudopneumoniae TaxID=257758 RepID=UPI00202F84AF